MTYTSTQYLTCDSCGAWMPPGTQVYNVPARPGAVVIMAAHVSCPS